MPFRTLMILVSLLWAPCVLGRRTRSDNKAPLGHDMELSSEARCDKKTYHFQFGADAESKAVQLQNLGSDPVLKIFNGMQWQADVPRVRKLWESTWASLDWKKCWPKYWDPERSVPKCENDVYVTSRGVHVWSLKMPDISEVTEDDGAPQVAKHITWNLTIPLSSITKISHAPDDGSTPPQSNIMIQYTATDGSDQSLTLLDGHYYPERILQVICRSVSHHNSDVVAYRKGEGLLVDPIPLDDLSANFGDRHWQKIENWAGTGWRSLGADMGQIFSMASGLTGGIAGAVLTAPFSIWDAKKDAIELGKSGSNKLWEKLKKCGIKT